MVPGLPWYAWLRGSPDRHFKYLLFCVPHSREIAENFRTQILNGKERDASALQTPVRTLGSVTFLYLRHADIYILALTRSNANAMLSLKFITSVRPCVHGRDLWR
jgi:hypothetical protein